MTKQKINRNSKRFAQHLTLCTQLYVVNFRIKRYTLRILFILLKQLKEMASENSSSD